MIRRPPTSISAVVVHQIGRGQYGRDLALFDDHGFVPFDSGWRDHTAVDQRESFTRFSHPPPPARGPTGA